MGIYRLSIDDAMAVAEGKRIAAENAAHASGVSAASSPSAGASGSRT